MSGVYIIFIVIRSDICLISEGSFKQKHTKRFKETVHTHKKKMKILFPQPHVIPNMETFFPLWNTKRKIRRMLQIFCNTIQNKKKILTLIIIIFIIIIKTTLDLMDFHSMERKERKKHI